MKIECPIEGCDYYTYASDDSDLHLIVETTMRQHLMDCHSPTVLVDHLWVYYIKYMYPSANGT